eukprot:COSAG01_NODE_3318_length_6272_cov_2.193261_9_plen_106_part_00
MALNSAGSSTRRDACSSCATWHHHRRRGLAWAQAIGSHADRHGYGLRVRGKIMGSQNCRIVGKSQSVLIMINPIIYLPPHPYEIKARARALSLSHTHSPERAWGT